jgi:hypothetical protein
VVAMDDLKDHRKNFRPFFWREIGYGLSVTIVD